jgi:hypothetical protein
MSKHNHDKMIVEFQRRRRRMLQNFAASMILIAVSLAISQLASSFPLFLNIGRKGWVAFAVAQFVSAVIFALIGFLQYRCPSCNKIIRGHDRHYLGVLIDPESCPNCGLRLS